VDFAGKISEGGAMATRGSETPGETRWRGVADLLREHLRREGISLKEFSRRSGISDTTLRALLAEGTPLKRPDKIAQLGTALGIGSEGMQFVLHGIAGLPSRDLITVDAAALDAAIEDVTRAMLHLRRVVDEGQRSTTGIAEHPLRSLLADS
jgi:lambda repressor-like predicted transcriptional regulator